MGFGTRRVVDVEVSTMKVILSKNTFDFLDNTSPSILPLSTNRAREECGSEGSGSWGLQSCRRLPRVFFLFPPHRGVFYSSFFKEVLNCTQCVHKFSELLTQCVPKFS